MAPRMLQAWRLLREVDFETIRRHAELPFQLLVAADDLDLAEDAAHLLGEGAHPWVAAEEPERARRRAASGAVDLAVFVTAGEDLGPDLHRGRETLAAAGIPLVTVALGDPRTAGVPRAGEAVRVASPDLEEALPELADAVLLAAPLPLRVALARQLPPLRDPAISELVAETARVNALYALTTAVAESVPVVSAPLNLADMIVLTKNQLVMSYRIALACGKRGRPRDVLGEVLGVIGGGFLFRQAGRQLVGLVPVAGIPFKAAVAWAGTVAIGHAVSLWARRGERLTRAAVARLYRDALTQGRGAVRGLLVERTARRRPESKP